MVNDWLTEVASVYRKSYQMLLLGMVPAGPEDAFAMVHPAPLHPIPPVASVPAAVFVPPDGLLRAMLSVAGLKVNEGCPAQPAANAASLKGAVCPAIEVALAITQPEPAIVALALVDIQRRIRADAPIPTKRLFQVIFVLLYR